MAVHAAYAQFMNIFKSQSSFCTPLTSLAALFAYNYMEQRVVRIRFAVNRHWELSQLVPVGGAEGHQARLPSTVSLHCSSFGTNEKLDLSGDFSFA